MGCNRLLSAVFPSRNSLEEHLTHLANKEHNDSLETFAEEILSVCSDEADSDEAEIISNVDTNLYGRFLYARYSKAIPNSKKKGELK
jgi:hypothetical protein